MLPPDNLTQSIQFENLKASQSEETMAMRPPQPPSYTKMPELHPVVTKLLSTLGPFVPVYNTEEPKSQAIKWRDSVYEGQLKNGIPEGAGMMIKPTGLFMHGSFKGGISNGRFRIVSPSNFVFEGNIMNDVPQGEGEYRSDSRIFKGRFAIGLATSEGEQSYNNGEWTFKGTYQMGVKKSGLLKWGKQGENQYINYFEGSLDKEGKYDGIGTLKTKDGIFKGEFKNGLKEGKGEFIYLNGCRYEGGYKRSTKYGKGTFFNANKTKWYEGDWHRDLPNGRGEFYTNNVSSGLVDVVYGIKKIELPPGEK